MRILKFIFAFGLLIHNLTGQVNLSNGLYICYPFDGNSMDFSGNANDGTLFSTTSTTDRFGNTGKALLFNGSNDYISINDALPDGLNFSVSVWVYHTKASYPSCILSDADDVGYNDVFFNMSNDGIGIDANKSGAILTRFDAYPLGNYNPAVTGENLNNSWHHIVWVCDQDSQKVYIDATLVANLLVSGSNVGYHNINPSIGRLGDGISNGPQYYFQYFEGKMDEFKYYVRALDFNDVKALYEIPEVCNYAMGSAELLNDHTIQIYPNPVASTFKIKSGKELKNASFTIYDLPGKDVKNIIVNGKYVEIDRANLSAGMYIYKIVQNGQLISKGTLIAE